MDTRWAADLECWLEPFVAALGQKTRRQMCPAYIAGLLGPGDRKSVQPMAARDSDVTYDQLHHFIGSGLWDPVPLEAALLVKADKLVGGDDAWLIVDDTALPKKGRHPVGVAPQYASALGKNANCQTMVSLTLALREVLVMVGLRLFLPESWTSDPERLAPARVPEDRWASRTKPEIALADAGYGLSAPFRQGLSARCGGRSASPPGKRSTRPMCRRCWRPHAGVTSAGDTAPRGVPRHAPPPSACGLPMVRYSVSATWGRSICLARRCGRSASTARAASANTIYPTCPSIHLSRGSPAQSRHAGYANRLISSLRKNWAWITMRAVLGRACTDTRS